MNSIKLYKNDIDKLFNIYCYGDSSKLSYDIVIINKDVREFVEIGKFSYFDDYIPEINSINIKNIYDELSFLDNSYNLIKNQFMDFYEGEGIIIEFEDEETAFYFKLKFC